MRSRSALRTLRARAIAPVLAVLLLGNLLPMPAEASGPKPTGLLFASDGDPGDAFGTATAASAEYLVIGAPGDDDRGMEAGAAYVFVRLKEQFHQVAKLTATDGGPGDQFGTSVGISNSTIAVGAPGDGAGSVYLFELVGSAFVQVQKISGSVVGDKFGFDLDIEGNTLVIGAPENTIRGPGAGAAYIYTRTASWVLSQVLLPRTSDVYKTDYFGHTLDLDGSVLAVSAYDDDESPSKIFTGSTYIYTNSGGTWTKVERIIPFMYHDAHQLGYSLSLQGGNVVLGAPISDNTNWAGSKMDAGAIFYIDWATWTGNRVMDAEGTILAASSIPASPQVAYERFGSSVIFNGAYVMAATGPYSGEPRVIVYQIVFGSISSARFQLTPPRATWDSPRLELAAHDGVFFVGAPLGPGRLPGTGYVAVYDFNIPSEPRNVEAEAGTLPGEVEISWTAPLYSGKSAITRYDILRSLEAGGPYAHLASTNSNSYLDTGLENRNYYYVVTATNNHGTGPQSNEAFEKAFNPLPPLGVTDGYHGSLYRPEAPTGRTPFAGAAVKAPCNCEPGSSSSVNLATGEFVATFPVTQFKGARGADFDFSLTYRSMVDGNPHLAQGWHATWLQYLDFAGADILVHTGDGRVLRFNASVNGEFEGPLGTYARIYTTPSGYQLVDRNRNSQLFESNGDHRLLEVADTAGNKWRLFYNAAHGGLEQIIDPHDRSTILLHDSWPTTASNPFFIQHGKPLLRTIIDPDGRQATIDYDATGAITAIRTQGPTLDTSYETRFTTTNGKIVAVQDNAGHTYLEIGYDAHGRVTHQDELDGAKANRHLFAYAYRSGLTVARDPNDNEIEWRFDHGSLLSPDLRVVPASQTVLTRDLRLGAFKDPDQYVTRYDFNGQTELLKVTYPRGNLVSYRYDESGPYFARGNLLEVSRQSGAVGTTLGAASSPLKTTYQYDATYNVVTAITDPRGNDPSFVAASGGPHSAGRYTTRIYYDFQEPALGDLNGDGWVTTSQDARIVRIEHPTVHPAGTTVHQDFSNSYRNQALHETFEWNDAGQLVRHRDPSGNTITYSYYPSNGAPLDATDQEGLLHQVIVDPTGLAITTTYTYNRNGAITQVVDPNGNVWSYDLDARGRAIRETGPLPTGYQTAWAYDGNDAIVLVGRERDANTGSFVVAAYLYDGLGRLAAELLDAHRPAELETYLSGQPVPPATGLATVFSYDGNGNLVKRTNGEGHQETWAYDERNLLLHQSVGPGNGTYTYDANGNPIAFQDMRGAISWQQHDGFDRPVGHIDALGTLTTIRYDPAGHRVSEEAYAQTTSSIGPQGRPEPTTFDALARLAHAKQFNHKTRYDEAGQPYRADREHFFYASGNTKAPTAGTLESDAFVSTLFEYDPSGQLVRVVDDNRHVTRYQWDGAGRLASHTDALGNLAAYSYDANGNVILVRQTHVDDHGLSPVLQETGYEYDEQGRLVRISNHDGTFWTLEYDGRGNVVSTVDELGNVVKTLYDDADRPWVITREMRSSGTGGGTIVGATTTTAHWDQASRKVRECDANQHCTEYQYSGPANLLSRERHADGITVWHSYDANGNLLNSTYSNGREVSLSYDALNRLRELHVVPDPTTVGTTLQTFDYDPMGRLTAFLDNGITLAGPLSKPTATVTRQEYDSLGRLVMESQNGQVVRHVLDGVGNIVSTTYPNGRVISRENDALSRLDKVWDARGFIAGLDYQGMQVAHKRFGSDTNPVARVDHEFDAMQRIVGVDHRRNGALLVGLDIRYDNGGHRVAQDLSPDPGNQFDELMTLDSLYRTTGWTRGKLDATLTSISNIQETRTWILDGANNWAATAGNEVCSRSHGAGNQVTTQSCSAATTSYVYDPNGNLHEDDAYVYSYDFLNRLVRVDEKNPLGVPLPLLAFGYDPLGRRIVKVVNEEQATTVPLGIGPSPAVRVPVETRYTYSGQDLIQESQPLRLGGTTLDPQVRALRQWVYGNGLNDVLSMAVDSNADGSTVGLTDARYYYHHDAHGSVIGLSDASGNLVEGYTYDPYGKPTLRRPSSGGSVRWDASDTTSTGASYYSNPFLYTGQYWDSHLGVYHYRARTYDPDLGRFLSRDPIGLWGDPNNLGNGYAYVGNSPWQYTDPLGLCPICFGAAVGAVVGAAIYGFAVATTDADFSLSHLGAATAIGAAGGALIGTGAGIGPGTSMFAAIGGAAASGAGGGLLGAVTIDALDNGAIDAGVGSYAAAVGTGAVGGVALRGVGLGLANKAPRLSQLFGGGLADDSAKALTGVGPGKANAGLGAGAKVTAAESKFSNYVFKVGDPSGKGRIFRGMGYGADDSAMLAREFEQQAASKYASGAYRVGKADAYGQRLTIDITLQDQVGYRAATFRSGWMLRPDGSLTLNTPFAGW